MPDAADWPRSPLLDIAARVRPLTLPALVVAHRGDSQNAPENTLGAFALALAAGAEVIEFDVQQSADGDLMVIHDDKVDRTTDGKGEVLKQRTEALQELSAGAWFSARFADERVPTLDETLDLMKGKAVPMIEVKVKTKKAPDAAAKATQALVRHGMEREGVVICRELAQVRQVQEVCPETPIAYLTFTKRQARNAMKVKGVQGIDCYWKSLSLALVNDMREARGFITPWTVNRARDIDRLLLLGCEAIIGDSPVTLRDRIEGFEFERTDALIDRFRRGETRDVDLEEEKDPEAPSPDEVARGEESSEIDAADFMGDAPA
jgi:glycerophosphoryl diester phosphodiesterase